MQSKDLASELDAQREPLRRLAAALLGDAHGAEDVVQDAFAAALARDERPLSLATWLRAVVRRLAMDARRRTGRRNVREAAAARPETSEEAGSLERLELVEALAREARGLDEPFRTALVLRYFDGLAPRDIATKLGVPLATVESRLVRALERLRERLDRSGGRERWLAATVAWIRPPQVPWLEILLMKTATKVVAAATVAILLGWWTWTKLPGAKIAPHEHVAASVAVPPPTGEILSAPEDGTQRSALATPAPAQAPQSTPAARLAGLVMDGKGRPLPDVDVGVLLDGEKEIRATPRAKSDAQGRFEFDEPEGAGSLRAIGDQWFTLGAPPFGPRALPCERVLCVVPREALEGVVVDNDGLPVEGVRVELALFQGTLKVPGAAPDLLSFSRAAVSAHDGKYRIDDAPVSDAPSVSAQRRGSSIEYYRGLGDLRALHGRIVFDYADDFALMLHGKVVDEKNQPIAGAWIDVGPKNHKVISPGGRYIKLRSDERGEFRFPIEKERTDVVLMAAASGRRFVTIEPSSDPTLETSWPTPLVIRLDKPALAIRGSVLDEQGDPLPDAWIEILDGTPWGFARRVDEALEPMAEFSWETLASNRGWTDHVEVDAEGRFEIGELSEREYTLVAFDPRSLHFLRSEKIRAGASDVEFVIDTSERRELVAGRVVDSSGAPVPGAKITLGATIPWRIGAKGELQQGTGSSLEVVADAQGRFEFRGVSAEANRLSVDAPASRWFGAYTLLSKEPDLQTLRVTLPSVVFVEVELSEETIGAGKKPTYVFAVDERGMGLRNTLNGMQIQPDFAGSRRSGAFAIADTARFLIVRYSDESTLRIPVKLEPGKLNVIRQ